MGTDKRPSMRRRLRFATFVIISQMLLVALALASLIQVLLILANGSVYLIERNPSILWGEITATVLIILIATCVLVMQIQRLGERRRADEKGEGGRR